MCPIGLQREETRLLEVCVKRIEHYRKASIKQGVTAKAREDCLQEDQQNAGGESVFQTYRLFNGETVEIV